MNIKTRRIYSEVYQVLMLLGNEYTDKLPSKLLTTIEEKRDINYNPIFKDNIALTIDLFENLISFMHYVNSKTLLSSKNGMNLYRGCTHGCIPLFLSTK